MRSLCMCGNLGMLIFLYILIWLFIVSFSLIHIFNCSVSFQAYGSHNFFSYPKTLLLWFLISSFLRTNRLKILVRVREREGKMIVNQPLKPLPMGRKPKRGICMCVCVCVCVQHRWDVCVCDWVTLLYSRYQHHIVKQSSSVAQSCPTLREPMDCSTPGFLSITISQSLLKLVHQVSDANQPSRPLSSLSPPAFNLSQHQGLFQWVSSSHQVAKELEFQLQALPKSNVQEF